MFLYDRSKVRYFRRDGHNWKKKADGRSIRETHEKLKVRSDNLIERKTEQLIESGRLFAPGNDLPDLLHQHGNEEATDAGWHH